MSMERDLLLKSYLQRLRLPSIAANYEKIAWESMTGKKDYVDYLKVLMEQEVVNREANALKHRISDARFPIIKELDTFDFTSVEDINQQAAVSCCSSSARKGMNGARLSSPPTWSSATGRRCSAMNV